MDKLMKSKKLMFALAMLSLLGVIVGLNNWRYEDELMEFWFYWTVPLIIQLIYIAIFRDSSKSD
ncbi:hypothetical protein N9L89_00365 [Gammaproteobacteria bacterium]|nr:hypothetical protein [Gammaproteobacteria bacterium]